MNRRLMDVSEQVTPQMFLLLSQTIAYAADVLEEMCIRDRSGDMTAAATAAGGTLNEMYEVQVNGEAAGYAVKVTASGSQGSIEMMVGVDAEGAVTGVSVVNHSETSGIGTKVVGNEPTASGVGVLDQFIGKSAADGTLTVGTNVDAITGATVSTKGVTAGVNAALAAVAAMG